MNLLHLTALLLSTLAVAIAAPATEVTQASEANPQSRRGGGAGGSRGGGSPRTGRPGRGGTRGRPYGPPNPNVTSECAIPPTSQAAYCAGTRYNTSLTDTYICGDWRLGPVQLPTMIPLDSFVEFYDRFGGLCPGEFIGQFWDTTLSPEYWRFPGEEGFALGTAGEPIKGVYRLEVGVLVDRFGGEGGSFVSPAAAPYIQRALPPSNLDTPVGDPKVPYSYHLYRIIEAFDVEAGPILPWFGQPGMGVQYSLMGVSVRSLVDCGKLVAVDTAELYHM